MTVQPIAEKTAGALGVAFLLGAPLVLAQTGWPLEPGEPRWPVVLMHLRAFTLPTPLLLAALVVAVAGAWTTYAIATAVDLLCVMRGRAPRLAVARLAAALLTAAAAGSAVASPAAAAVTPEPAAAAAHSAAPADTSDEEQPKKGIERHRTIAGFAFDSQRLNADMRTSLKAAAELIRAYGDAEEPITVTGHTDPTGHDAYNMGLSQRRAEAAASYLRGKLAAEFTVTAEGEGSSQPPADGRDSYADLRRVEIDYRLQPPPAPASAQPAEETSDAADHTKSAPTTPGRKETSTGIAAAAVAGGVGAAALAGGYVLTRRNRRPRPPEDGPPAPVTQEDGSVSSDAGAEDDEASTPVEPVDEEAAERPHHLRLGPGVVVDAADGLSITGAGAAGIVTALLDRTARAVPGSVIATRAALAQIGCTEDGALPGVTRVNGSEAALVRVEAHLIAAQRAADEDTGEAAVPPTVLLEGPGEGPARERVQTLLNADPVEKPTLIALADLGQGTRADTDTERVRITDAGGTVRDLPASALWCENISVAEEPPPVAGELSEPVPEPPVRPDSGAEALPQRPGTGQPPVVLRMFAPRPAVEAAGADVTDRMRAAARLLLAYLAIHPNGASGDELGELLAPNTSPHRARAARNNAVSSVRSTLRAALRTDAPVVESISGRYRLQKDLFDVDLWHFNEALARAKNTTGACVEDRHQVLRRYSHELLSSISEAWVETERHRCRRRAAETCVQLAEDSTETAEKISWLDRACAIDSHNEMVHRMLVEVHADNDDPDAIHRTYQRFSENLREIGERPSKELRALVERRTCVAPMRTSAGH